MNDCCQGKYGPAKDSKVCADCPVSPKRYVSISTPEGEQEIARIKRSMQLNSDDPITADKERRAEEEALHAAMAEAMCAP